MFKVLIIEEGDPEFDNTYGKQNIREAHFVFKYLSSNTIEVVKTIGRPLFRGFMSSKDLGLYLNNKLDEARERYTVPNEEPEEFIEPEEIITIERINNLDGIGI